jgi:hypothetical protein
MEAVVTSTLFLSPRFHNYLQPSFYLRLKRRRILSLKRCIILRLVNLSSIFSSLNQFRPAFLISTQNTPCANGNFSAVQSSPSASTVYSSSFPGKIEEKKPLSTYISLGIDLHFRHTVVELRIRLRDAPARCSCRLDGLDAFSKQKFSFLYEED